MPSCGWSFCLEGTFSSLAAGTQALPPRAYALLLPREFLFCFYFVTLGMEKQAHVGVCPASQTMEMMAGLTLPIGCKKKKAAQRILVRLLQSHIHPFWGNSPHSDWIIRKSPHREDAVNKEIEFITNLYLLPLLGSPVLDIH